METDRCATSPVGVFKATPLGKKWIFGVAGSTSPNFGDARRRIRSVLLQTSLFRRQPTGRDIRNAEILLSLKTEIPVFGNLSINAVDTLRQWNNVEGNPRGRMSEFIGSPKVKEFLKALAEDESHRPKTDIGENQLLMKVKGGVTKEGVVSDRVWTSPLSFIKFATRNESRCSTR